MENSDRSGRASQEIEEEKMIPLPTKRDEKKWWMVIANELIVIKDLVSVVDMFLFLTALFKLQWNLSKADTIGTMK